MRNVQLFSTDTDDGVVSVVAKTGSGGHRSLKQIRVGNAPRGGVKFTGGGRGFVCNTSQNTISEIDPVALVEVRRVEVGHGPRGLGIVPGDRYALVSNSGSDTVSIVDLELNVELRQLRTGRDPRHMIITADGRFAYVCIWGEGYICKLDLAGLSDGAPEQVAQVAQIAIHPEAHPYSANIDPSGRRVFVANTQAKFASVIDVATDEVQHIDLGYIGGRAVAFTPDGRYALITVETVNRAYVVEVESLKVTRFIPTGPGPRGLVVDGVDSTVYITNFDRNSPTYMDAPDYGPNALTMVDLKSAPLDRAEGSFTYQPVPVGYGPCSVVMFDLNTLPEEERSRRLEYVDAR